MIERMRTVCFAAVATSWLVACGGGFGDAGTAESGGNVAGVVGAGLILGLVNGLSGAYGTPEWTNAYTFGLLIVILILRPQGLFGGTMGPAIE